MTAQIIQFIPKPNPNRVTLQGEAEKKAERFLESAPSLNVQAAEILSQIDTSPSELSFGAGIDGIPYLAPPEDCA